MSSASEEVIRDYRKTLVNQFRLILAAEKALERRKATQAAHVSNLPKDQRDIYEAETEKLRNES